MLLESGKYLATKKAVESIDRIDGGDTLMLLKKVAQLDEDAFRTCLRNALSCLLHRYPLSVFPFPSELGMGHTISGNGKERQHDNYTPLTPALVNHKCTSCKRGTIDAHAHC